MGSKQTTTNKTEYDPAYMARINANYDRTKSLAESPYAAYTGERVASLTPTQTQAKGIIEQVANDQTGASTLDQATGTARGVIDAGILGNIGKYMNPYTHNVIDTTLADLSRARDIQRVADNQRQTAESAFGGSRHGVADSLTNDAYLRNVASTTAGLRSAGYDKAVANATTDANLRLNGANQLAGFSDQELRQALQRAGALSLFGEQEQATEQAKLDAQYEEFLRAYQDPFVKQQLLNSALGAYPVQATTTSTATSSPGLGGILGGVGSLALGIGSMGTGSIGGKLLGL